MLIADTEGSSAAAQRCSDSRLLYLLIVLLQEGRHVPRPIQLNNAVSSDEPKCDHVLASISGPTSLYLPPMTITRK